MTRICETCFGDGRAIEFRRYAGEYIAGEPVEVVCPDCDGQGEWDEEPLCPYCDGPLDAKSFCASCEEFAEQLTEVHGDPMLRRTA
jgi:DnaJ-class molecular chaperone